MDIENNKYEMPNQQRAGEPGSSSASAQRLLERGSEAYGQAEKAVSNVYDKTVQAVSKTYERARSYSSENPGTTLLLASGIGAGLGFLMGAISRRSRTGE